VDLKQIDEGKVICFEINDKYLKETKIINYILKNLFYYHAMSRFDQNLVSRKKQNIICFYAGEAQNILNTRNDGLQDHSVLDKIREVKATVILTTESEGNFNQVLGNQKAEAFLANIGNKINV